MKYLSYLFTIGIALVIALLAIGLFDHTVVYGLFLGVDFLWIWYLVDLGLKSLILLFLIGFAIFGSIKEQSKKSNHSLMLKSVSGLYEGSKFSFKYVFRIVFRYSLILGGVFLMRSAGGDFDTLDQLNMNSLGLGFTALLLGTYAEVFLPKKTPDQENESSQPEPVT